MTEVLYNPKIKPEHLARKAIIYLRQSSEKQVRQNKESQLLQYAVAERVRALGWKQVEIINSDLGSSAGLASAQREGFERVLSLVALGQVGIVGSRELSRLSRTDKDWCRLLEVCQIFGTLIADQQQLRSDDRGFRKNGLPRTNLGSVAALHPNREVNRQHPRSAITRR